MKGKKIILHSMLFVFLNGYLNAVTLFLFNASTTHHTGNIGQLTIAIFEGNIEKVKRFGLLAFLFFLGAAVSGWLLYQKPEFPHKIHGILALSFCLLLFSVCSLTTLQKHFSVKNTYYRSKHLKYDVLNII